MTFTMMALLEHDTVLDSASLCLSFGTILTRKYGRITITTHTIKVFANHYQEHSLYI